MPQINPLILAALMQMRSGAFNGGTQAPPPQQGPQLNAMPKQGAAFAMPPLSAPGGPGAPQSAGGALAGIDPTKYAGIMQSLKGLWGNGAPNFSNVDTGPGMTAANNLWNTGGFNNLQFTGGAY